MFTRKMHLILAIWMIAMSTMAADPGYVYHLDLSAVKDDRLQVELLTPPLSGASATFYLPKIVPGTYSIYDFGRFVSDLQAFDARGNRLSVERQDVNTWTIGEAERLHRLTYWVDDSDDGGDENPVFGMSGTSIRKDDHVVLNTFGFFGYFAGMKELPVELRIDHPASFYGATALVDEDDSATSDHFRARNYHHLADSPILYGRPDTVTVQVAGTEVLIAVNGPEGNQLTAQVLADEIDDLLRATRDYLGGQLPVDRYAFLLHLRPQAELTRGTGALEHSYSSLYYMPALPPVPQILAVFKDIAAHEFLHILTPLNLHSEEIHYFDFNDPDMSRHLWLYEGVTEYFSHHIQIYQGLIDEVEFRQRMAEKLTDSQLNYDDALAFTKLSEGSLDKHKAEYGNVYQKGALIGACLDIELRRWSDGTYGLKDLIADLTRQFGPEQPFRDRRLFKEIARLTSPEVGQFFRKYLVKDNPLPYEEIFRQVGWQYIPPGETEEFSVGNISLGFNPETGRLIVQGTSEMNEIGKALGYQAGDELVSVNGERLPAGDFGAFFDRVKSEMTEGEPLEVVVARPDGSDGFRELTLRAKAGKTTTQTPPQLLPLDHPTAAQLRLRDAWLNKGEVEEIMPGGRP